MTLTPSNIVQQQQQFDGINSGGGGGGYSTTSPKATLRKVINNHSNTTANNVGALLETNPSNGLYAPYSDHGNSSFPRDPYSSFRSRDAYGDGSMRRNQQQHNPHSIYGRRDMDTAPFGTLHSSNKAGNLVPKNLTRPSTPFHATHKHLLRSFEEIITKSKTYFGKFLLFFLRWVSLVQPCAICLGQNQEFPVQQNISVDVTILECCIEDMEANPRNSRNKRVNVFKAHLATPVSFHAAASYNFSLFSTWKERADKKSRHFSRRLYLDLSVLDR